MADEFDHDAPNQERDMNNNGILDIHEPGMQPQQDPGYQHRDSYEVGRDNTSGSPIVRHQREAMAHYAAAHDSSTRGAEDPARNERVRAQTAAAAAAELKIGSDPDSALSRPAYEKTLHDIDVARKRNAAGKKKSSLPAELAATRPHKEDKAHGAEILTEMFKGIRAGHKHAQQTLKEQEHERNQYMAEALQLRRANDQDLIDHELALMAEERKKEEAKNQDRPQNPGSEGPGRGPGEGGPGNGGSGPGNDSGPGGGNGPDAGPGPETAGPAEGPEGPGPNAPRDPQTVRPEPGDTDRTAPNPANDVGIEREPSRVAAEVETKPVADAKPELAKTTSVASPTKSLGKEAPGVEASGGAAMGAVLSTVNPALGIAATAIQTQGAQKAAGTDHASETKKLAKGPQQGPGPMPARTRTKVTFSPGQPVRRLAVPKPVDMADRDKVVSIPVKRPARVGALHAQASRLALPSTPMISKGVGTPMAMSRALGVGLGSTLVSMMKPVVPQNEGPNLVEQMHQNRRSGNGAGR